MTHTPSANTKPMAAEQTLNYPDYPRASLPVFRTAIRIALVFVLATIFWTVFLDYGLALLIVEPERLRLWQAGKDVLFLLLTALVLVFALQKVLRRQQEADQAFLAIQSGTAGVIGQDYFQFLTENLPKLLGTRVCFVGEWDPANHRLKVLAGHPAEFVERFPEYPLQDTPCQEILDQGRAMSLSGQELARHPLQEFTAGRGIDRFFGVPLMNQAGQSVGLLVTFSDHHSLPRPDLTLTILEALAGRASSELARLHSETRNREYFNQLATVFDSLNAGIYVADMETHELLYVNRFIEEQFGEDWRGRPCYSYLQDGLQEACAFCTNSSLLVDGRPGPPVVWEFRNSRDNRWYQCLDKCIRWTDGRLVRLEIALDITAGKEMEQTKEELLSAVSHEMRTPLTAITGFTELLLEEESLPDKVQKHLRTVFAEAEKMTDLVNTFLDLRRLKANRARVDYEPLLVSELLQQGIRRTGDCTERHQLSVRCPPDLHAFGNRQELTQVVAKLLSNACRFSPAGGPIFLEAREEEGRILLCFTDSGIGIPEEEHARIFDHFHRLDRGDRRRTRGAGLGLSLVRETVELHGGRVWVESEPGRGSHFMVELPSCRERISA